MKEIYQRSLKYIPNERYGKDIIFTTDSDYTHAVIINWAMPELNIPKENVIGMAHEPLVFFKLDNEFVEYVQKNVSKYYICDISSFKLPEEFIAHHGFMPYMDFPVVLKPKTKLMSIVFSNKCLTIGHQYRKKLVKMILDNNYPIDIWGYGCSELVKFEKNSHRIKGSFNGPEPYEDYLYTISIENTIYPEYFTEKILNPLVYNTIPLYYGATNIDNYFPGYSIKLTGDPVIDIQIIKDVLIRKPFVEYDRLSIIRKVDLVDHLLKVFGKTE